MPSRHACLQFTNKKTKAQRWPTTINWWQEPKNIWPQNQATRAVFWPGFCSSWFLVSAAVRSMVVHKPISIHQHVYLSVYPYTYVSTYLICMVLKTITTDTIVNQSFTLSLCIYYKYVCIAFFFWSLNSLHLTLSKFHRRLEKGKTKSPGRSFNPSFCSERPYYG